MKRIKMKGLFGKIAASALALSLCLGGNTYAADVTEGTPGQPPEIKITHTMEMPVGTVYPSSKSTFKFSFESSDPNAPAIQASLKFDNQAYEFRNDIKHYEQQTRNILSGLQFSSPGVYTYTVTQEPDTVTSLEDVQKITYSDASYTMKLWVEENPDVPDTYYIKSATVENEAHEKIDPANGEFCFANTYDNGLGEPSTGSFIVSNSIKGDYADPNKSFSYQVSLADTKKPHTMPVSIKVNGTPQSLEFGNVITFDLAPGETWVLEAPYGTLFDIEALADEHYSHKHEHFWEEGKLWSTRENKHFNESLKDRIASGKSDNANGGTFPAHLSKWTHTYDGTFVPPTGISVNTLPFIVLIGVAAAGIAAYFVSRRRKRS